MKHIEKYSFPILCFLISVSVISVWLMFPKSPGVFPIDDAYIHLTYAKNLASTGHWEFNAGEPSLGTSSPLWAFIISIPFVLHLNPYWTIQIFNLFLLGLSCLLAAKLVIEDSKILNIKPKYVYLASAAAGLTIALNGNIHWLALSGMETLLFITLVLAGILNWTKNEFNSLTGIICGLLILTRLPGLLLPFTLLTGSLWTGKRIHMKGVIALCSIALIYAGLSYSTSGRLLPVTAKGKRLTYVDGGFKRPSISLHLLSPQSLFKKLLVGQIVKPIQQSDNKKVYKFHRGIYSENILNERCIKAGITKDIHLKTVHSAWRGQLSSRPLWFLWTMICYQNSIPQNFILFTIFTGGLLLLLGKRLIFAPKKQVNKSEKKDMKLPISDSIKLPPGITSLTIWCLIHTAVYTCFFRTLLHHGRYFANIHIAISLTGIFCLLACRSIIKNFLTVLLLLTIGITSIYTLPWWMTVYKNNVAQIENVYFPMAEWIKTHTPANSKVAAFDIGILAYRGKRYVIDIGGLVDPKVHKYLERQNCAPYIEKAKADYMLYSRNPDVDVFTRVSPSLTGKYSIMKENTVASFRTNQFKAPTLTHSFALELVKLQWLDATRQGIVELYKPVNYSTVSMEKDIGFNLKLVDFSIEQPSLEIVPHYPHSLKIALSLRCNKPPPYLPWLNIVFVSEENKPVFKFTRRLTNGRLVPDIFPLDTNVIDSHQYFLPTYHKPAKYKVKFCLTGSTQWVIDNYDYIEWTDLGSFEMKKNKLKPYDHMQWIYSNE